MGLFNVKGRAPRNHCFGCVKALTGSPERSLGRKKRPATSNRRPLKTAALEHLEIQFQSELELTRVKRGGRPAVKTPVTRAFMERIHIVNKWRGGGFVESVEEIEALRNDVQPHAFLESNAAH